MSDIFSKISEEISTPDTLTPTTERGGDAVNLLEAIKIKTEPPLSAVSNERPFAVDLFEIDGYEELNDFNDIDMVRIQVETIEDYVKQTMASSGLKDTKDSYKEVIDKISNLLDISDNETGDSKIYKIYSAINLTRNMNNLFKKNILDFFKK